MNMGNTSFPKLHLVKPSGRLIKELTHYRREVLYNRLVEVMVTSGMKSIISQIVETCPICTMNNSNTRPPKGPR